RIQKSNADLLGGLKPDIMRVELGEKGTFWRLRAGPLSEQAAKTLCGQLKERNQGCIIARK
ncbi:MAG: SPOR domain-containing protein, partial [Pseudomonadota bacterium]